MQRRATPRRHVFFSPRCLGAGGGKEEEGGVESEQYQNTDNEGWVYKTARRGILIARFIFFFFFFCSQRHLK